MGVGLGSLRGHSGVTQWVRGHSVVTQWSLWSLSGHSVVTLVTLLSPARSSWTSSSANPETGTRWGWGWGHSVVTQWVSGHSGHSVVTQWSLWSLSCPQPVHPGRVQAQILQRGHAGGGAGVTLWSLCGSVVTLVTQWSLWGHRGHSVVTLGSLSGHSVGQWSLSGHSGHSPVPSPFILDEFKRKYSNEDTLGVALPHFWEHFDREGWSLWYCQYRYPEELSQTFMSCNLITGMFQRLDKLRKNAFASVILFGSDHDSSISGVWLLRGQELAFTLCPDWQVDYESPTPKSTPDPREFRIFSGFSRDFLSESRIFLGIFPKIPIFSPIP
uniref:Elongation factor 1-gamma-like n=1 Tax=Cyanistes caeruleus TaxID=156563 RepID=A0A8C0ZHU7_CYACU